MKSILYSGERAKEVAHSLFPSFEMIDAKSNEDFSEDSDVLGIIISNKGSALPRSIESYIERILAHRDNKTLGYIFAIFLENRKHSAWAPDRLNSLLSDSGCVLSYYAFYERKKEHEIEDDVENERFKISKNGFLYRIIKNRLTPYED